MSQEDFSNYGSWNMWYSELHKAKVGITFKVNEVISTEQSPFQKISIFNTEEYGKVLLLDSAIMLTERDEFVYHEMISHPALFVHPDPKNVLVIGGGDGGTLREVAKHTNVEKMKLVEIDGLVIEKAKQYLPFVACGFDDPRVEVSVADGIDYVQNTNDTYQIILVDSADPVGPAEALFKKEFFMSCSDRLGDDGILIAQSESPFYHADTVRATYEKFKSVFPIVEIFTVWIPTYPSGLWSFAFCSKKYHPIKDFHESKYQDYGYQYYNKDLHRGAFAVPSFVKRLLD